MKAERDQCAQIMRKKITEKLSSLNDGRFPLSWLSDLRSRIQLIESGIEPGMDFPWNIVSTVRECERDMNRVIM